MTGQEGKAYYQTVSSLTAINYKLPSGKNGCRYLYKDSRRSTPRTRRQESLRGAPQWQGISSPRNALARATEVVPPSEESDLVYKSHYRKTLSEDDKLPLLTFQARSQASRQHQPARWGRVRRAQPSGRRQPLSSRTLPSPPRSRP